mgnify:FL=1
MQKQKRGFLLFISSLIPGAGEMYMGFFKQGISIMTLFWLLSQLPEGLISPLWLSFFLYYGSTVSSMFIT